MVRAVMADKKTMAVNEASAEYSLGVMDLCPHGYKQTEVGVIPDDWDVSEIRDLSRTGSGTTPSRSQHERYFNNGRHHWVKTTDLNNSIISDTEEKVTAYALSETCLQVYPPDTVLVAMYGGFNQIGRTGILNISAAVNQALIAIVANKNQINPKLLISWLNYRVLEWKKVASSSRKDPNITSNDVKCFKVAYPNSLVEQESIARALSDVNELIVSLEKLIAKKRDIKTATMQQLLTGKKRLPGFGQGKGYKQTELGEIPEDWDVRALGAVGNTYGGLTGKSKSDFGTGTGKYVTFLNVMMNVVINPALFEEVKVSPSEPQNKVLKGDLLFNGSSETPEEVAMCSLVADEVANLYLNSFCFGFRLFYGVEIDRLFLVYYLRSNVGREMMKSLAQGSTRYNLSKASLLESNIYLPLLNEQETIASVLSDMDAEITTQEVRCNKTKAIKQGMMQELLTGRTRLIKHGDNTNG